MQTISYGVSLTNTIKQQRDFGQVEVSNTTYYAGRSESGKLLTGRSHEARQMTHTCAELLVVYLSKTTSYTAQVVELIGDDSSTIPNSLGELGEGVSLTTVVDIIRSYLALGHDRAELLRAVAAVV